MLVPLWHAQLAARCSPRPALLCSEAVNPFWLEVGAQAAPPDGGADLLGAVNTARAPASPSSAATQEQIARVSGVYGQP